MGPSSKHVNNRNDVFVPTVPALYLGTVMN